MPKMKNKVQVAPAEHSEVLSRCRQGSLGGQSPTVVGCSNAGGPLLTWSTALSYKYRLLQHLVKNCHALTAVPGRETSDEEL